ncbi:MAG: 4-hydroxy-tetrahydrodipicolinate reductase, partial [Clostridia bacterium]|nr:4-hydroxy-tetrahydrodipicolinate reductase [Clostridia bacterium]
MDIIINGINGAMGQAILKSLPEFKDINVVAGVDKISNNEYPFPVYSDISLCDLKADAIIDFSRPEALDGLLQYAKSTKTPLLVATTGLSDEQKEQLNTASKDVAIFFSANMSLGVNLQMSLIAKAASFLYPDFEVEIVEKHHNKKVDAPSGTAYALADSVNNALDGKLTYVFGRHGKTNKREPNELGIHAVRGGTIVGEHSVMFIGRDEVIEIN